MPRIQLTTCFALILFVGLLASAGAQLPGTMFGLIYDYETEEPLVDVTITITNPEAPDFKQIEKTNKRGRYRLLLANATVSYAFELKKPGYQTVTLNGVKIPARQETRRNFRLRTEASAAAAPVDLDAPSGGGGGGPEGTYNKGVAALNGGDLEMAAELFESAIEMRDELGVAHAALARVYRQQEEYERAIESALRAIELDTGTASMNQVLYDAYSALGETDKADAALTELQSADPVNASKNLFNEAADAYNSGDMVNAKSKLQKLVEIQPDHAKGHYMLGLVLASESDNAGAKAMFERFLELAPNDPGAPTAKEMLNYLD